MAYEIKKNAMLRFMKKQAKVDKTIDERQREVIEKDHRRGNRKSREGRV